jgi:hypothetical protein
MVRFGETMPTGSFGSYRFWISEDTIEEWSSRAKGHNGGLDTTFIYNGHRIIYSAGALYSGSA